MLTFVAMAGQRKRPGAAQPEGGSLVICIMDHPVIFATQFARLVRLIEERSDVTTQKATLRSCLVLSKQGAISLSVASEDLLAAGTPVPTDPDVLRLRARIAPLGIGAIVFERGAAPGDVLSAARWLVESRDAAPGEAVILSGLRTVCIEPQPDASAAPAPTDAGVPGVAGDAGAPKAPRRRSGLTFAVDAPPTPRRKSGTMTVQRSGAFPAFDGAPRRRSGMMTAIDAEAVPRTRAAELLELLDRAGGSSDVQRAIDDVVAVAENAVRDGELEVLADAAVGLFARRGESRGDDLPARCDAALTRLLTAPNLRLLIQAAARSRPRADAIHAVVFHAGEDGAAAVVAQVILAATLADRRLYFEMLLKLPLAIPVLSKMLGAPHWHVARNAADLLGELRAAEAEGPLTAALQHADERVRRAAAHALAKIGTPSAADSLGSALADSSPLVRVQVAAGLSTRKAPASTTTLTRALDAEGDSEVQLAILNALGRLGTPDAVNRLIKAAEPDGRLFKKKPISFRVAAVHALGEIRTPAARAVLQSLANDKEREVREAVLRA
jgi:HEAT repeat protein